MAPQFIPGIQIFRHTSSSSTVPKERLDFGERTPTSKQRTRRTANSRRTGGEWGVKSPPSLRHDNNSQLDGGLVRPSIYSPRVPSISLASQLMRATEAGESSEELIYSDLTGSICELVPVDEVNLFLKEAGTSTLYLQPQYQPIRGSMYSTLKFDVESRQSLSAYAAESGQAVWTGELPKEMDKPGSKLTNHILAQPVINTDDQVIAVVEVQRRASRNDFTQLERQRLVKAEKANAVGDFILDVVKSLFSKVHNMDEILKAIMNHSKELVRAERVTIFQVDSKANQIYPLIMDVGDNLASNLVHDRDSMLRHSKKSNVQSDANDQSFAQTGQTSNDLHFNVNRLRVEQPATKPAILSRSIRERVPLNEGFCGYVVRTGKSVVCNNVRDDPRFYTRIDELTGHTTQMILAMPLMNGDQVIGVIEFVNKIRGIFTDEDVDLLNIYSTYCSLALNIAKVYDQLYRSDRKFRVAIEVLTFHNQVDETEVEAAMALRVPDQIPGIDSYSFSPWDVALHDEIKTAAFMLYDLTDPSNFDHRTTVRFLMTVRKNYRPVSYHNWDHGFSVAHSMYYLLKQKSFKMSLLERACLFIASLCHDLDHRGHDNRFVSKLETPLAALYGSSPLEHHHFNMTVMILQQKATNVFSGFKTSSYRTILGLIKHAILSTDLAVFFDSHSKLSALLSNEGGINWKNPSHRLSVISIAMPTCDLCAMYKPWDIQVKVVMLIMQEFWAQGDQEKALDNSTLMSLMDRTKAVELSSGQVGFITAICQPCFTLIARVLPELTCIVDSTMANLDKWKQIAGQSLDSRMRQLSEHMALKFDKVEQRRSGLIGGARFSRRIAL